MNCDSIAPYYRWLEYLGFGRELERRRFRLLPQVRCARRVLVLGDGDGRFLARLAGELPHASIVSIEASARMQALARSRSAGAVQHIQGDARTIPLQPPYDLIATHFFLDCFDAADLESLIERIATAAAPGAQWLISEFRLSRAWWSRACIGALYLFFRITTGLRTRRLVDHHPLMQRCGFRLVQSESSWFGLLASELWARP